MMSEPARLPRRRALTTVHRRNRGANMNMRTWGFTIGLGLLLAGCSSSGETLRGVFLLNAGDSISGDWDDCEGTGGYEDIDTGANVRIENEDGSLVGAARLRNVTEDDLGWLVDADRRMEWMGLASEFDAPDASEAPPEMMQATLVLMHEVLGTCALVWEAEDLEEAKVYSIEVASRGALTYTRREIVDRGFVVSGKLGD